MQENGHILEIHNITILMQSGGDCTNFVSQCIYAGSQMMNYDKIKGWYYRNGNDKSPSWTGVEFLYQFLTTNKGIGPFGNIIDSHYLEVGDIIQLRFDASIFSHTLIVVEINPSEGILTASHTMDSYGRKINTYPFKDIRYIHLAGVRI